MYKTRARKSIADRFWAKVRMTDECWIWIGTPHPQGYGVLAVNGRPVLAHRLSWALHNGPIPEGRVVMHSCDNRICVRPDHLMADTQRENILDASRKRRLANQQKTHCPKGHPYSGDNLGMREGRRRCMTCHKVWTKAVNARRDRRRSCDRSL